MSYGPYQGLCYAEFVNWQPFIHIQECATQRSHAIIILLHPNFLLKVKVHGLDLAPVGIGRGILELHWFHGGRSVSNFTKFSCKESVMLLTGSLLVLVKCIYICSQICISQIIGYRIWKCGTSGSRTVDL